MSRSLLLVRAGDQSLHRQWLQGPVPPNFDLLISYFGDRPETFVGDSNLLHVGQGTKYPVLARLLKDHGPKLAAYDCIAFPDDDLAGTTADWNRAFDLFHRYRLDLAQPAIAGHPNHPQTAVHPECLLRYGNFVESQTPMFSRRALARVQATFAESLTGWGLDWCWGTLLPFPEFKLAILDAVSLRHTRPMTLTSDSYVRAGADPWEEDRRLRQKYQASRQYREYYRVLRGPEPRDMRLPQPAGIPSSSSFCARVEPDAAFSIAEPIQPPQGSPPTARPLTVARYVVAIPYPALGRHLPALLEQLQASGLPLRRLTVWAAEAPHKEQREQAGLEYVCTRQPSSLAALWSWAAAEKRFTDEDPLLFLHAGCRVGTRFGGLSESFEGSSPPDMILPGAVAGRTSLGVCALRVGYLRSGGLRRWPPGLQRLLERRAPTAWVDRAVLQATVPNLGLFTPMDAVPLEPRLSDGQPRHVAYFPGLDLLELGPSLMEE